MTDNIKLPPLPEGNVAHLIAAQATEIEALRAEVALERGLKADAIRACALANIRAKLLADALRQIAEWPDGGNRYGQENIKRFAKAAIDEAMEKENSNERAQHQEPTT